MPGRRAAGAVPWVARRAVRAVPVAAGAALLLLGGCAAAPSASGPAAVTAAGGGGPAGASGPGAASSAGADDDAGSLLAALPAGSALVATATAARVDVFAGPSGGTASALAARVPGAPLVLRVTGSDPGGRLHVQLPRRPNGSTGWVPRGQVTLSVTPWQLAVHRGAHRLDVERDGKVVATYPVGVGTSVNPTPPGTYFLSELLAVPGPPGAYGPFAFGLSAFSPTLTSFAGGPGQLGLHGTDRPDLVGTDVSHGCLRVTNEVITSLAHQVPLGSPVRITP